MPSNGQPQVKCEPPSDEEDSTSQFSQYYLSNQLPSSEICGPNHNIECQNDGNLRSHILQHLQAPGALELPPLEPAGPAATPVCVKQEPDVCPPPATLETLEPAPAVNGGSTFLDRHMALLTSSDISDSSDFMPLLVKDEPVSEGDQGQLSGEEASECGSIQSEGTGRGGSVKSWNAQDMENALDALRNHNMSLTKASARFGIPSTTLWQRAHRLGIDTPKKEAATKSWGESELRAALHALRAGAISANKASKAYGIPSSTLYKIARREGIRLSAPFNAAPTAWRRADLERALDSIRTGAVSVQRAAATFGIPTGTLYGRCKREGIELSRSNPTPWSEDAMGEALEAVRVGQMSINQAAIHYNLPYSSLYGRFKRCKYQVPVIQPEQHQDVHKVEIEHNQQEIEHNQQELYYPHMHPVPKPDQPNLPYTQLYTNELHDTSIHNNVSVDQQYTGPPMYYAQSCNGILS